MDKRLYHSLRMQLDFRFKGSFLLQTLALDFFLCATIFALFQLPQYLSLLAAPFLSVLMIRNVSLMHEAVHGTAHPRSSLNDLLGIWAGTLCLLPFYNWKMIHMEHHFWTGNFHRDPSMDLIRRYPSLPKAQRKLFEFLWKTRIPLMACFQYAVFWIRSARDLLKNYRQRRLWLNMIFPVLLWSAIILSLNSYQLLSLALAAFLYLGLFEVINFPHHVGSYLEDSPTAKLPVWQQHEITRSTRYPTLIEKYLVLNFNYHGEHHVFPDLPWHQLPQAHQLIQESAAGHQTIVVSGSWLPKQRRLTFAAFVRPDLPPRIKEQKAS